MATAIHLVTNILQNIVFCAQQLKEIHTGLGSIYLIYMYLNNTVCQSSCLLDC